MNNDNVKPLRKTKASETRRLMDSFDLEGAIASMAIRDRRKQLKEEGHENADTCEIKVSFTQFRGK